MAHFAEVIDGIVVKVLVVEQEFIDTGRLGPKENWIQTSYNSRANVHSQGGTPLRKNFAGIGMIYDPVRDAFYEPQPFPSWILNETTCQHDPPTPMPTDNNKIYKWDEPTLAWKGTQL